MKRNLSQRGFTLVELLVVLLIVGLVVGVISLSIGSGTRPWERAQAVERFAERIQLAQREAEHSGRRWGVTLTVSEHGWQYRFLRLDAEGWVEAGAMDPVFGAVSLPEALTPSLVVQGLSVDLQKKQENPPILLFESGELTPFTLYLRAREGSFALQGHGIGRVQVQDCALGCGEGA